MRNRQQREFRKSMRRMAREKKAQGYDSLTVTVSSIGREDTGVVCSLEEDS